MAILFADKLPESVVSALTETGLQVRMEPSYKADDLERQMDDVEILVVRSTKVTRTAVENAPRLSLIVRAGAGVNTIDLEAASEKGIVVANCPGRNAIAVAELVFGLILAIDRRIPECTASLRRGEWDKKQFADGKGLYGRSLGVIGAGKIGQAVIDRAHGFGMEVTGWSRSLTEEIAASYVINYSPDIYTLASQSDIITVHLASTAETMGLFDFKFFQAMRPGAMFINCARGNVVDEPALLRAMDELDLRAGLDVFENEPGGGKGRFDSPIKDHPNLVATHHLGASTQQAASAIAAETLRIIQTYLSTGKAPNTVNIRSEVKSTSGLSIRHEDRVGVLANILNILKQENYNVEEMHNRLFQGGMAATAMIMLDRPPSTTLLESLESQCNGIIDISVVTTG